MSLGFGKAGWDCVTTEQLSKMGSFHQSKRSDNKWYAVEVGWGIFIENLTYFLFLRAVVNIPIQTVKNCQRIYWCPFSFQTACCNFLVSYSLVVVYLGSFLKVESFRVWRTQYKRLNTHRALRCSVSMDGQTDRPTVRTIKNCRLDFMIVGFEVITHKLEIQICFLGALACNVILNYCCIKA